VGSGLTVGVDEDHLSVAALYKAVIGQDGASWTEPVKNADD